MLDTSEPFRVGEVLRGLDQRSDRKVEIAEVPINMSDDRGAGLRRGGDEGSRSSRPYAQRRVHVGQRLGCDRWWTRRGSVVSLRGVRESRA